MKTAIFSAKYTGLGGEVKLDRSPYLMTAQDFTGFDWTFHDVPLFNKRGSFVSNFRRNMKFYKCKLKVTPTKEKPLATLINELTAVFEKDIYAERPGRLYINDDYLECYITASNKVEWNKWGNHVVVELTILAPHPVWYRISRYSYFPGGGSATTAGKKYTLKYQYNYAFDGTDQMLENEHYSPALAIITIFGYAVDPQFIVDGHVYKINDTIQNGDRVEIDQLRRTITKIYANGTRENIFGKRGKEYSVFESLPAGKHMVTSSGSFGVDIELYQERSEPEWKSSTQQEI